MTNLTKRQTALLSQVRDASEALRLAKKTIEREVRLTVAERITAYQSALDNVVRLAYEADIPKARIGREGLLTTNSTTVANILGRTAHVAEALAAANNPLNERYQSEGELVRVTLTADEARDALANFGQDAENPPLSALFERHGSIWSMVREPGAPTLINGLYEHPLSLWATSSENRAELAEWAAEQGTQP